MRKGSGLVSSALVVALALSACVADRSVQVRGTQGPSSATAGSPDGSPAVDERLSDLSYLIERAESIHPRLYHGVSRHRVQRTLGRIEARLDRLDRYDFMVEVMRLLALFGLQGGEAHTGLFPFEQSLPLHFLPVRLYLFPEGVFVVEGRKELDRFVGSELTHIDGVPVDRIVRRVTPLISRDNRHSLRARVPWLLAQMEVLHSLGITEDAAGASLRFRTPGGTTIDEAVRSIPSEAFQEWAGVWHEMIPAGLPKDERVLTLARNDRDIWLEYLPEPNLIFLQYNVTLPATNGVARRLGKLAREHPSAEIVLDLRHNSGGNVGTFAPLLDVLIRRDIRTRLLVLIGRATLSASGVLLTELEERFDPLTIGEPTGAKPTFYGDPVAVRLPTSDLLVEIAGLKWPAHEGRERDSFEPDVKVELHAADYFEGRDPVLEWVIGRR